jgi:enterochelin esterase-like enzyme
VFYSELLRGMWWNGWADALLTPVSGTDLFYRTYRVRADMRFVYWLAPNLPLHHIREVTDWDAYQAHWQVDPRNPKVFRQDLDRSYVELPAAPPQHWHQPRRDGAAGSVTSLVWQSALLGNERTVWIATPPGYQPQGEPYPLLLLFDGDVYTTHVPAPTILDNLVAAGRIPPTVAVLIDSPDRAAELGCDGRLVDCLADELLPWVRARYHVTTDPGRSVVGGVSLGGLMAAYVAMQRPDLFGNVLAQSGAFGWGREAAAAPPWSIEPPPEDCWLVRAIAERERLPLRFWLEAGLLEDHRDASITSVLQSTRHLRNVLAARGYPVSYHEFAGGHQYITWRGTLPDALVALLGQMVGDPSRSGDIAS